MVAAPVGLSQKNGPETARNKTQMQQNILQNCLIFYMILTPHPTPPGVNSWVWK